MSDEEKLIEELVKKSGKSREEIEELVENKIKEFNGLISRKGAILLVAKKLGVKLGESKEEYKEKKIVDIEPWELVKVKGVIRKNYGVKEYSKGKYQVITLGDETGVIKVVIWNIKEPLKEGQYVEIVGRSRINKKSGKIEIHTDKQPKFLEKESKKEPIKPKKEEKEFVGICIVSYPKRKTQTGKIVSKALLSNLKKEIGVVYFGDFDWEVGKIYKVRGRYAKNKVTGKIEFFANSVEETNLDTLKEFLKE